MCGELVRPDKYTGRLQTLPPGQMQIRRGMPNVPRPGVQLSQVPTWTAIARSVSTPNAATLPTKEAHFRAGRHSVASFRHDSRHWRPRAVIEKGAEEEDGRRVRVGVGGGSSFAVARRDHPRRAWTPRCRSPHEYTLQAPSYSPRLRRDDEVDALKDDGEPGHRRRKRGLAGQGLELQDLLTAV